MQQSQIKQNHDLRHQTHMQQQQQMRAPVLLSQSFVVLMMCGNCTSTESIEVCPSPSQVYQYTCSNCRVVQTFNISNNSATPHGQKLLSSPPPSLSMDMELSTTNDGDVIVDMPRIPINEDYNNHIPQKNKSKYSVSLCGKKLI